jgi:hypothetical protein
VSSNGDAGVDQSAEEALLGSLLINPTAWDRIANIITTEDIYKPNHKLIFSAIATLAREGKAPDSVTVAGELERLGHLQVVGGLARLGELGRNTPTSDNIQQFAGRVVELAAMRRVQGVLEDRPRGVELRERLEREIARLRVTEAPPKLTYQSFTTAQILAPIEPEEMVLPGVPASAYTLLAGALSSYKTTLLAYWLVWKATGWDVLTLDTESGGIEIGKSLLITFEDTDKRIFARLQRVVQHGHQYIKSRFGDRDAREFVERAAANLCRLSLSGNADSGLVHRVGGVIVPNEPFVSQLIDSVLERAPEGGALVGLDPLRLAIAGSQNDDDGADVVVHTLNRVAAETRSALVASSHSTKAGAQEAGTGYAAAAYATSGSALFSNHARSNFRMARLTENEIISLFDPADVSLEQANRQRVVSLIHGRDSHGPERAIVYLLMEGGTLTRVLPGAAKGTPQILQARAPHLIAAIDRMKDAGVRASAKALEADEILRKTLSRVEVRTALQLLLENGHLEATGDTKNRNITVTDSGRNLVKTPTDSGESRRESSEDPPA